MAEEGIITGQSAVLACLVRVSGGGTKRRLGLSVYYMIGQGTSVIGQGIF